MRDGSSRGTDIQRGFLKSQPKTTIMPIAKTVELGRDVRIFVVGGRVVGAIERTASTGDWRTNVARGGTARPIEVSPAWREHAIRAASVVGADYAGVDIVASRAGLAFVLEVNGIPGWRGLQTATAIDVAA